MTTFLLKLRNRHFFALDLIALAITPALALALRLDRFEELPRYAGALLVFTLMGLAVRLLIFWRAGLYGRYWRYASVDEIALIALTVAAATAINTLLFFILRLLPPCSPSLPLSFSPAPLHLCTPAPWLPRSIPLISGMLTLIAVGGIRFSVRLAERWRRRGSPSGKRVLIIGAGDAGRMIVREMQANLQLGLEPVGFIDDDPTKQGVKIQGLPVLGDRERIPEVVREYKLSQAIIAMPTASGKTIRRFVELCQQAGVEAKTIPGIYELLSGQVSVSQIRNVDIEDLLRREPVEIEADEVIRMVEGKRVLVTGAGGSIGAEICRQVAQHGASELILLGHGENSIFQITRELQNTQYPISNIQYPIPNIHPVIADIRDLPRLKTIFDSCRPHIVFHAAAHKHVPLMECNVEEAVSNNVLGTQCLIKVAEDTGVERFVLISTDKAVNPCNVMGATKRVCEMMITTSGFQVESSRLQVGGEPETQNPKLVLSPAEGPETLFTAVRFGNVLDSRGSVVQIFREQIARGGPVTVTHPDMRRYFMTIPEAVQLVLQAAAIGRGGEIFVLDMGDAVPIVQLAHDLIKLSGLEVGRDIDIEYIGARPGEKLFEELFADGEEYQRTHHEKIFVCRNSEGGRGSTGEGETNHVSCFTPHVSRFTFHVDALIAAAERGDRDEVRRLLKVLVPEYELADGG